MTQKPVFLRSGAALACLLLSAAANAQDRPSEADLFGGNPPAAPSAAQPAPPTPPTANPSASTAPVAPVPAASAPAPVAAPPGPPAAAAESAAPSAPGPPSRDAQILGSGETPMFSEETAPDDPLKIGGQIYLRAQTTASRGQNIGDWAFSSPSLLDVYLDAVYFPKLDKFDFLQEV